MSYEYLAGPYSGNEIINAKRHAKVLQHFLAQSRIVFSPIVHCHDLAIDFELPKTFEFWQHYNAEMLDAASGLIVICSPGWTESVGTQAEILIAKKLKMPIEYLSYSDDLEQL